MPTPRQTIKLGYILAFVCLATSCSANPTQIVSELTTVIAGLLPLIATGAALLLPAEATAIQAAVPLVTQGLATLKSLINNYHANPTDTALAKVTAAFADVQANLTELEKVARVSDPATQRKLLAIVQGAVESLALLEASMQGSHPSVVASISSIPPGG